MDTAAPDKTHDSDNDTQLSHKYFVSTKKSVSNASAPDVSILNRNMSDDEGSVGSLDDNKSSASSLHENRSARLSLVDDAAESADDKVDQTDSDLELLANGTDGDRKAASRKHKIHDDESGTENDVEGEGTEGDDESEDSSEEEDDDDEEAARQIREGFIVDDDVEEEEGNEDKEFENGKKDVQDSERKRHEKRREREEDESEGILDEEDLALVLENRGELDDAHKYKRLKRRKAGELSKIFSEDEAEEDEVNTGKPSSDKSRRPRDSYMDEFADFIEDDEFSDEVEQQDNHEIADIVADFRPEKLGISADDAQEIYEIFGDGQDFAYALDDEEEETTQKISKIALNDVFEPSKLAEKLLTDQDEIIRITDQPERFQLKRANVDADIHEEALWIRDQIILEENSAPTLRDSMLKIISNVLNFFENEALEVPFIWRHRLDFLDHVEKFPDQPTKVSQLANIDTLWRIFDLDCAFRSLKLRKNNLVNQMITLGIDDAYTLDLLQKAKSLDEVNNVLEYFHFAHAVTIKDRKDENRPKRPHKSAFAIEARSKPIYGLVKSFGIDSKTFSSSAKENHKILFPEEVNEFPEKFAESFVENQFPDVESCLNMAVTIIAEELSYEPDLRNIMRDIYLHHGKLSTSPTESGLTKIDEEHPYYNVKYVLEKPLNLFEASSVDLLLISQAEEEGLLTVSVNLGDSREKQIDHFSELMYSDAYSEIATSWNRYRRSIVDKLFQKLQSLCSRNALESQKAKCRDALKKMIRLSACSKFNQRPYTTNSGEIESGDLARVLAISSGLGGSRHDATIAVCLDEEGNLIDSLKINSIMGDENKLIEFVKTNKPDIIGVSGLTIDTFKLFTDIEMLVNRDKNISVPLVFVNDEVARFYFSSEKSGEEFPELSSIARYCVGLARYIQNPLLEYLNMESSLSSIKFSPFQKYLPEDMLNWAIETALVDIVNLVGVDINRAIGSQRLEKMIPYVSGFGPRKTQSLIKRILATSGKIKARTEFVTKQILTKNIFMNCSSFFKINVELDGDPENGEGDILDSTRVHNEDYDLAKKMAADALELDEEDLEEYEESSGIVAHLINSNQTDKLDDLVLEEYADQLEASFGRLKRRTLQQIREELKKPYTEKRGPFKKMTKDQIFEMLTGESVARFSPGMVVPGMVKKITSQFIALRLGCGIEGNVARMEFPEDSRVSLQVGQVVDSCIMRINKSKFTVDLSLRESIVKEARNVLRTQSKFFNYWNHRAEQTDRKRLQVKSDNNEFVRVIKHPLFHRFSAKQAEEYLAPLHRGDAVIRPSSLGNDHIVVTWKIADGLFQHIDVQEYEKDNEFSVGKVLQIGKYTYTDLDELLVSHIKSIARKIDEMVHHSKFQNGSRTDTETWLERYSEANPRRSVYAFCFNRDHPGYFDLCFKTNIQSQIYSWPVKVVPDAFVLRDHLYGEMNTLCNGFKIMYGAIQRDRDRGYNRR